MAVSFILISSQPVSVLNAVCLEEKQQIPILVFGFTWLGLEPTIYRTQGEQTSHYTTDAVIYIISFNTIKKDLLIDYGSTPSK